MIGTSFRPAFIFRDNAKIFIDVSNNCFNYLFENEIIDGHA